MSNYRAPVEDMQFVIDELCDIESTLGDLEAFADKGIGPDLTTALLDESARLCGDVWSPLRRVGDQQGATCADGRVTITPGYAAALKQLGEGGWLGISAPEAYGMAAMSRRRPTWRKSTPASGPAP